MLCCFGFVTKTVLITHPCFSHCRAAFTQCQRLFCSSPCPTSKQAGVVHAAGKGHSQDGWPKLTPGISHTILHLHSKNCEEGGGRRDIGHSGNSHCEKTWHCRKQLNICLPIGSSEWISYFASACGFLYLLNCFYLLHFFSYAFTLLMSPPSLYGEQASS